MKKNYWSPLALTVFVTFSMIFALPCFLSGQVTQKSVPDVIGGGGADELDVELFVDPEEVIVGYQIDLTAEATGGKPKYSYAYSLSCNMGPVAIAGFEWEPFSAAAKTFDTTQPGTMKALALVMDQDAKTAIDSKAVTILPPTQVILKNPTFSVTPKGNRILVAKHVCEFDICREETKIGPAAVGVGQEKILAYDLEANKWATDWSKWIPTRYTPEFGFRSGTIYDKKRVGVVGFANAAEGTVFFKVKQQVRFVYRNACAKKDDPPKAVYSKTFLVIAKKKGDKVEFTLSRSVRET